MAARMAEGGLTGASGPRPQAQRAVLVLPSTGEFDTRSRRIGAGLVARGHDVTLVARWEPGLPHDERTADGYRLLRLQVDPRDGLPIPGTLRRRLWSAGRPTGVVGHNLSAIGAIRATSRAVVRFAPPADLVHGMAFMGIPAALAVGRRDGAPVVYDALDLYTDAGRLATLPRPLRAAVGWVERRLARRATAILSANEPYAEIQAMRFGRRPVVVYNGALRQTPAAADHGRFQRALGLPLDRRIVLYHGGFSPHRGIEQLIDAIGDVPGAVLVCMGYGTMADALAMRIADAGLGERVRIMPAVPPEELLDWVAAADVAAMLIQPSTLNHRLTTPNKLFEAMAAGVPVLASDLPGMASVVRATGCGLLVDPADPVAIAARLREMLDAPAETRAAWSASGRAAAAGPYGWDRGFETLLAVYAGCTGRPW